MFHCNNCNSEQELKCVLPCGDKICFLCIKITGSHFTCSLCNKKNLLNFVTLNTFNTKYPYCWLYSSVFADTWWAYDFDSNKHIEVIYNDYLKRSGQSALDQLTDIKIKIKNVSGKTKKNSKLNQTLATDTYVNIVEEEDNHDVLVSFLEQSAVEVPVAEVEQLSYIINVANSSYKIDFDQMKQINLLDSHKQRHIKRASVPVDSNNKKEYLMKKYNVVGFVGVRFSSS